MCVDNLYFNKCLLKISDQEVKIVQTEAVGVRLRPKLRKEAGGALLLQVTWREGAGEARLLQAALIGEAGRTAIPTHHLQIRYYYHLCSYKLFRVLNGSLFSVSVQRCSGGRKYSREGSRSRRPVDDDRTKRLRRRSYSYSDEEKERQMVKHRDGGPPPASSATKRRKSPSRSPVVVARKHKKDKKDKKKKKKRRRRSSSSSSSRSVESPSRALAAYETSLRRPPPSLPEDRQQQVMNKRQLRRMVEGEDGYDDAEMRMMPRQRQEPPPPHGYRNLSDREEFRPRGDGGGYGRTVHYDRDLTFPDVYRSRPSHDSVAASYGSRSTYDIQNQGRSKRFIGTLWEKLLTN